MKPKQLIRKPNKSLMHPPLKIVPNTVTVDSDCVGDYFQCWIIDHLLRVFVNTLCVCVFRRNR